MVESVRCSYESSRSLTDVGLTQPMFLQKTADVYFSNIFYLYIGDERVVSGRYS